MPAYSDLSAAIEEIKSRTNIVDVIGRDVQLKRSGSNYKGLCPFHGEKTPSFVVSEQKQIFTCFGCGVSGNVIEYVKRRENLDFMEAVKKLAAECGVELRRYNENSADNAKRKLFYEINREAAIYFFRALRDAPNPGYAYMRERGVTNETLHEFGIGYAGEERDGLFSHLRGKGYETADILALGLIGEREGGGYADKFRGRVIFPIINTAGEVIGFGGRALRDFGPKYLNSSESPIFLKKNNLYALNLSKNHISKESRAILVEGYMDVISLYQAGIKNVSASLGTALTENQARLLKRYTKNVTLSYDADSAGRAAALRGIEILRSEGMDVRVLHVSDGKDPDEFVKKNGREAFKKIAESALPYVEYKLENAKSDLDFEKDEDRLEYVRRAADILRLLSPAESEFYAKRVAEESAFSEKAVEREIESRKASPSGERTESERKHTRSAAEKGGEAGAADMGESEKLLIKLFLMRPDFLDRFEEVKAAFKSDFSAGIAEKMREYHEKNGEIELSELKDSLDIAQSEALEDIFDQIRVSIDEETLFEDTKRLISIQTLKQRERSVIEKMELIDAGDEEDDRAVIVELSAELSDIHAKLKELCAVGGGKA